MKTSFVKEISKDIINEIIDSVVTNFEDKTDSIKYNKNNNSKNTNNNCIINFDKFIDTRFSNIVFFSMVTGLISVIPSFYYLYNN